jgi:hypothetical protein
MIGMLFEVKLTSYWALVDLGVSPSPRYFCSIVLSIGTFFGHHSVIIEEKVSSFTKFK